MKTLKKQYSIFLLHDSSNDLVENYSSKYGKKLTEWKSGFVSLKEAESAVLELGVFADWVVLSVYRVEND